MSTKFLLLAPGLLIANQSKIADPITPIYEQQRIEDSVKSEAARQDRIQSEFREMLEIHEKNCLAKERTTKECLAEISQYNQAIDNMRFPENWATLSAGEKKKKVLWTKSQIVNGLASQKYFSFRLKSADFQTFASKKIDANMESERAKTISEYSIDALKKMYRTYFNDFFKGGRKRSFSIVASTDSNFIDSMFLVLATKPNLKKTAFKNPEQNAFWQACDEVCLISFPPDRLDSLNINDFTKPIPTSFGYAILRLDSVETTPEMSFDTALQYLPIIHETLASRQKPTVDQAKSFYAHHIEDYETQDTLIITAWLMPPLVRNGSKVSKLYKPYGIGINTRFADTLNIRPKKVTQFDLPERVRNFIYPQRKLGQLSVVLFEHGLWSIKINEIKLAKGGFTPKFDSVKNGIMHYLDSISFEEAKIVALNTCQTKILSSIQSHLQNLYHEFISKTDSRLSEKDLKPLPSIVEGKPLSTSDSLIFENWHKHEETVRQIINQEIEEWLNSSVEFSF